MKLAQIQAEIKAGKNQVNKFGNYRYRSCEDIVEAAKPVLFKYGFALQLSDEVVLIGNRFYIRATASILGKDGEIFTATAYAREEETKKGMDVAQITGSASSYARKYALNGLFAIDDTKDADATNTHGKDAEPTDEERNILNQLVYNSDLSGNERDAAFSAIQLCPDYATYQKIQHRLEARALPFDQIPNPSQGDINKHIKKTVKA